MTDALVIFDQPMTPAAMFAPGAADPLLDRIRAEVEKEIGDPSTPAGRKRIVSLAMKVTKTKTAIEAERVKLVGDEKKRLSAIDAEGKRIRDALDVLAEDVRKPVTEWEDRDKARIAGHEARIEGIASFGRIDDQMTGDQIAERLAVAEAASLEGFEEFAILATNTKARTVESLSSSLSAARKTEAEREELARLRKEASEREQHEREEAIAAKARAEAEEAAKDREEKAARDAAEREASIQAEADAKERAAAEAFAASKREHDAAEARAVKAEADRVEAERRAKEAADQAERDRIAAAEMAKNDRAAAENAAAERERQRISEEQQAERKAAAKREADKAHKAKVNNEALTALVEAGMDEAAGNIAIGAIARGLVPNVKISY